MIQTGDNLVPAAASHLSQHVAGVFLLRTGGGRENGTRTFRDPGVCALKSAMYVVPCSAFMKSVQQYRYGPAEQVSRGSFRPSIYGLTLYNSDLLRAAGSVVVIVTFFDTVFCSFPLFLEPEHLCSILGLKLANQGLVFTTQIRSWEPRGMQQRGVDL